MRFVFRRIPCDDIYYCLIELSYGSRFLRILKIENCNLVVICKVSLYSQLDDEIILPHGDILAYIFRQSAGPLKHYV